ncbi:P-loop containing nucleoside triphosphate hydrolase protein [Astrocystis sublimbata]|nr:P-loop containing nucleoside triphosphate hydrolase protein [Astrocystis sublimbata]
MQDPMIDLYLQTGFQPSVGESSTGASSPMPPESSIGDPNLTAPSFGNAITGMKLDLIDLTARYRAGAQAPTIAPTGYSHRPRLLTDQYSEYALRIIREIKPDGSEGQTTLEISSPIIQAVFRRIMSSYAFLDLAADPIVIKKPFAPLFHYRQELKKVASESENEIERTHMRLLMDEFYKPYLGEIEKIYRDEVPKGRVRFELLWTLFRAEDDVLVHTNHYREMHRVMHYEECVEEDEYFRLYTWRWGYNAGKFGPCSETVSIPHFSSTRRISQLPCFPVKQLDPSEAEKIYRDFVNRGMKWRNLIKPSHRSYQGPTWVVPEGPMQDSPLDIRHSSGQIVLDHQLHAENYAHLNDQLIGAHGYQINGLGVPGGIKTTLPAAVRMSSDGHTLRYNYNNYSSRAGPHKKIIFNQAECHKDDESYIMSEEEALLSPARTRGFSLFDKTWGLFMVEGVTEIDFSPRAFDSLALDPYFKDTIQALVQAHDSQATDFDDIITGKGRGVIISLEGAPGSGKTLTAESMAEVTKKPLYAISTSELGTEARRAEKSLRDIFRRTQKWNAVVLLDEADLFLTKRTVDELDRNALVTVFLRTIEYFQGIMFITSNRVEHFDPAFESRIHLRIPFESPGVEVRTLIWETFLEGHWVDDGATQRLGRDLAINGREIKNIIRISRLVAKHRKEDLSEELIRSIFISFKQKPLTSQSHELLQREEDSSGAVAPKNLT